MKKQKKIPGSGGGKGKSGIKAELEEIIADEAPKGIGPLDKKGINVEGREKRQEEDMEEDWDGEEKRWSEENPQDEEPGEVP